jgi:hypothetical protein
MENLHKTVSILSILCLISAVAFAQSITLTPTSAGTNTEGKMYYSTTTHSFQYWNGNAFIPLGGSSAGAGWSATGSDITNTNTGNVGVGLASPLSKLHVRSGGASGFTPGLSTSLFTESDSYNYITIASPNSFDAGILFGKPAAFSLGSIVYNASNNMDFSTSATQRLTIKSNGLIGIYGNNALEFGYTNVGKDINAGKIGYGVLTTNTLDIVGAGNSNTSRKVKIWAEGGSELTGSLSINGEINNPSKTGSANMIPIAYGTIDGVYMQILNGSGNFSITRLPTVIPYLQQGNYILDVNNETFTNTDILYVGDMLDSHIVTIQVLHQRESAKTFFNANSQGKLKIIFPIIGGNLTYQDTVFSFVIYKP